MDKLRLKISTSMSSTGCKLPALMAFAVSALFSFAVIANPIGGSVTAGQASISSSGSTLTVNQSSDKAIIDWRGFDINTGETTRFSQPGSSSITLNRVNASTPSQINGTLTANGNLVIINPNGVIFDKNSQVNVNSLIATSSDIDNSSFMQNSKLVFNKPGSSAAQVINQGNITVYDAGLVGLVAPHVENNGVINARLGKVTLASGDEFTLDLAGDGLTQIALSAPIQQFAGNSGIIQADGGLIQITAAAARSGIDSLISNTGVLEARSVGQKNGIITLYAEGSNAVANNDITQKGLVSGASTVTNSGTVDASGYGSGQTGGTVQILGDNVNILSGSHIDASGDAGGGTIRIGGDFHGQGITPTALKTNVESQSAIKADAVTSGNGGNVTVWADDWTGFAGFISARGGVLSGNGGFVETSGHNILQATGLVDAGSPSGSSGHWLLDPNNITIANSGSDNNISCGSGTCTTTNNNAFVTTGTINAALNSGTDITIQTGTNGSNSEDGYILVNSGSTISKTSGGDATLTLESHQGIFFDGSGSPISINSTSGKLNLVLHTDSDQTGNGTISMNYTNINTNNGNITFGGGADPFTSPAPGMSGYTSGISLFGDSLSAGSGNILLQGKGYDDASTASHYGILMASGTTLSTTSGNITLSGTGGTSSDSSFGIVFRDSGTSISSTSGQISLTGTAGTAVSGSGIGILSYNSAAITSGNGSVTLSGTTGAGSGGGNNMGIWLSGLNLTSSNGNISLTGTGASGGTTYNNGIQLDGGTQISSTGTATISLNGTGGDGTSQNYGVRLDGSSITSATGNISLTGQGGNGSDDQNKGIAIVNGSTVSSTGTAAITLSGTGGSGTFENNGIYMSGGSVLSTTGTNITLNGTGGSGSYNNYGVFLTNSNTAITTQTGSISITGQGGIGSTWAGNYGLFLDSDTTVASTGSSGGNITLQGTGGAGTFSNDGVVINGTLSSVKGDLTIDGTGADGTHDNYGVYLTSNGFQNGIITSQDGNISITGHGGNGSSSSNNGIILDGNTTISTTGNGHITLNGTGGAGTLENYGIRLDNGNITSAAGNISLTGQGGNGSGDLNKGIDIVNSSTVSSTDTATITLSGTGGNGASENDGIYINGSTVSSVNGNISFTGQGGNGSGDYNRGIVLSAGTITSTGTATIDFNGTGGGGNSYGYGDEIYGSSVASNTGNIHIFGQGGTATFADYGVGIENNSIIRSTGSANISIEGIKGSGSGVGITANSGTNILGNNSMTGNLTLAADSIDFSSLTIRSGGVVTMKPYTASTSIGINGGSGTLSDLDTNFLALIDTGTVSPSSVVIGNSSTGSGTVTIGNNWNISGYTFPISVYGGTVNFQNIALGGYNLSLNSLAGDISGAAATIISKFTGGDITLTLASVGSILFNGTGLSPDSITSTSGKLNLVIDADSGLGASGGAAYLGITTIDTNGGNVTIGGGSNPATTASHGTSLYTYGIALYGSSISTGTGNITLTGTGWDDPGLSGASGLKGIYLFNNSSLATSSGNITLNGTGGLGSGGLDKGIYLDSSTISSTGGHIGLTGNGGNVLANYNFGLELYNYSQINATGNASITLQGTGNGNGNGYGVILDVHSSINAVNGDISITGQGASGPGPYNDGVVIGASGGDLSTVATSGTGKITVHGTGGSGAGHNIYGTILEGGSVIGAGGDVVITGQGGVNGSDADFGLLLADGANILNTGNISLTAVAGGGTNNFAFWSAGGANYLGGNVMTGNLTLIGDSIDFSNLNISTAGTITLKPYTASTSIGIHGGSGTLGDVDSGFLSFIDTGTVSPSSVIIGNSSSGSGAVTIGTGWNISSYNFPISIYGGSITTGSITGGSHNLLLDALNGNITLNSGAALTSTSTGTGLTLVASGNFINNSGASALSDTNGRWLVYSTNPASDTLNSLASDFRRFSCTYGGTCPSFPSTGNGFLYTITPTITVTPSALNVTYGSSASLSGYAYTLSGYLGSDASSDNVTGTLNGTTSYAAGNNVGSYNINYSSGTLASALGYAFSYANSSTALSVLAKTLTASLTGSVTKTYNGNTTATLSSGNYSLTGIYGSDVVNLNNPTSGTYDTKDVGTGKTVSVTGLSLSGAAAGNYTLASASINGAVGQIDAKSLTASLTGSVTKTYDTTTAATLASGNYSLAGVVSGDTVNLNNPTSGTYDTKNAGTGKTVSVTGLSISGTDAGNYTLSSTSTSGAVGQITAKSLTASLTGSVIKTYDGTTAATLASGNYSLAGIIGGDTVNLNNPASGTYDTKNVGTGKTVTVTGLSISGTDAGNYTLSSTSTSGAVGQIDAKSLTASLTGSVTKTYDSTTAATLASGNYSLAGVVGGDTVNLNNPTSGTYDTKDVGTGKTVSVTGLSISGTDAGNYTLSSTSTSGAVGQINAKSLTASLTGSVTKTYDGTTAATLASGNYSLAGIIGGDTVNLNNPASGTYDTKNAGTGKTVSVTGLSISGTDAGNYTLSSTSTSGAVGQINAKSLTASLTGSVTKTYDGTTAATLASGNYSLAGIIGGDTVNLNNPASGTYDTKNVGTGKTVTVTGLSISGTDAGNYTLSSTSTSGAVGQITAKSLTANLTGSVTKTYDTTTAATLASGNYSLAGVVGGDTVNLNNPTSGTYDTKNAGSGKTVSVTGLSISGTDAGNYTLSSTSTSGAVGQINAKSLTASLTGNVTKTYDGTTAATLASGNYSLAGIIGGDTVNLNNPASGTYDTKNAGTGKTVGVTGLSLSGAAAGNYTLASTSISGTVGQINAKSLTASLTGSVTKVYDGTTAATLASGNYSLAGVVGGDAVNLNNPTNGTYDTADIGTGKVISVTGLSISGAASSNYILASNSISDSVGVITAQGQQPAPQPQQPPIGNTQIPQLSIPLSIPPSFSSQTIPVQPQPPVLGSNTQSSSNTSSQSGEGNNEKINNCATGVYMDCNKE